MRTLTDIFLEIGNHSGIDLGGNDKGGIHSYLETYDKLFLPFKEECSFLEMGLARGDSIKLWDQYFNNSTIVGVDLSIIFKPDHYKNNVILLESDVTKPAFTDLLGFKFDIIIDDASHQTNDQIATFNLLKGLMNKGGIYIIEDIQAWDIEHEKYKKLHDNIEIVDMRKEKNRYDNMLLIFRF